MRSARVPLDRASVIVPAGRVYVIPQRCKECRFCIDFCPKDVLVTSTETNAKGYRYPVVAPGKEEACVHCEFCSLVCPEYAIFTVEGPRAEVPA
ncbi:MAG: 4Fe-4S dicluster domain-containing protein [Candidatus Rokubacteria bacterium]|nr:4Fe-4S dicluster domain-containing protein [Candidatus Rokubacteria bacterium]